MIREAEENAESDRILKERVEAKNQLESYLYNLQSSLRDQLKDKMNDEDKAILSSQVNTALSWLDEHANEDKVVYEEKRKEVEDIANPIISKVYNGPSTPKNSSPDPTKSASSDTGPTVEEL